MLYSEKVMDHFDNPRNVGVLPDADGVGEVGNPVCGDIMKMYIKVKDNVITDVKFKTYGCTSAVASSSMATEMIKGHTIDEALKLSNKAVTEALDVMVKWFCIVFGNQFTPDEMYDNYPADRLMHDIALALMAVQTQTTEVLDGFPTKPVTREAEETAESVATPNQA